VSSWWIADSVLESVYAGVQCSEVSNVRQISPVVKEMLGCAMRVENFMVGGWMGYVGGMEMLRSQRPSGHKISLEERT
jgi:hypothetical protein